MSALASTAQVATDDATLPRSRAAPASGVRVRVQNICAAGADIFMLLLAIPLVIVIVGTRLAAIHAFAFFKRIATESGPSASAQRNELRRRVSDAVKNPAAPDHPSLVLSATSIALGIKEGDFSSTAVTRAFIKQAARVNGCMNAICEDRFQDALSEASKADALLAQWRKVGRPLSELPPFLGVPCSVKEVFSVTGMKQTGGMWQRRHFRADSDATVIRRLRAAGFIIICTTNTPELCMWYESYNLIYGRSNNAYDHRRIVGGSSGGEAALISAAGAPLGIGSDIGGSIRMPAAFNGVFGHKPSGGLVPNSGQHPTSNQPIMVTGPLCRYSDDLLPLLQLMRGPDGIDSACAPTQLVAVDLPLARRVREGSAAHLRTATAAASAAATAASKSAATRLCVADADAAGASAGHAHEGASSPPAGTPGGSSTRKAATGDSSGEGDFFLRHRRHPQAADKGGSAAFHRRYPEEAEAEAGSLLLVDRTCTPTAATATASTSEGQMHGKVSVYGEVAPFADVASVVPSGSEEGGNTAPNNRPPPLRRGSSSGDALKILEGSATVPAALSSWRGVTVWVMDDLDAHRPRLSTPVQPAIRAAIAAAADTLTRTYGCAGVRQFALPEMVDGFDLWTAVLGSSDTTTFYEMMQEGYGGTLAVGQELLKWCFGASRSTLPAIILALIEDIPGKLLPGRTLQLVQTCLALRKRLTDALVATNGVLLLPAHPTTAPLHDTPLLRPFNVAWTQLFNVLLVPATVVPMGLDDEGLPVAIQVVGASGFDALTIAVAQALEHAGVAGWIPPSAVSNCARCCLGGTGGLTLQPPQPHPPRKPSPFLTGDERQRTEAVAAAAAFAVS